jgi:hypothetical protein
MIDTPDKPDRPGPSAPVGREAARAAALRANLLRRKAQTRGREAASEGNPPAPEPTPGSGA